MRDSRLREQRDEDLYRVYVKGLEEGRFDNVSQAAEYVLTQPAPRFYISEFKANAYFGLIKAGVSLIGLNSSSRRRIWCLWHRYNDYVSRHPGTHLSRERILSILVEQPAPEFYLGHQHARKILKKEILKRRRKWTDC